MRTLTLLRKCTKHVHLSQSTQDSNRARYHVYARLYRYQTDGVRFYQIPDRILSDFGLDMRSEPFTNEEGNS